MSEENQNVFDKSNSDTIEKNFEKLDEIVSKMQSGEISLGEALEALKRRYYALRYRIKKEGGLYQ